MQAPLTRTRIDLGSFEELSNMFASMKTHCGVEVSEKELMAMSFQKLLGAKKQEYFDTITRLKVLVGRPSSHSYVANEHGT
ncbi:hypothetical protein F5Y06DRAFT_277213 [Hypoxylon sp. FL0890]|nr:hypothetical protein F5Y06DRAFT_277213 [Hypoxylon sp. FL0890]